MSTLCDKEGLRTILQAQAKFILKKDGLNWYFTALQLGHDPSPNEAWRNWVISEAAKRFREWVEHKDISDAERALILGAEDEYELERLVVSGKVRDLVGWFKINKRLVV